MRELLEKVTEDYPAPGGSAGGRWVLPGPSASPGWLFDFHHAGYLPRTRPRVRGYPHDAESGHTGHRCRSERGCADPARASRRCSAVRSWRRWCSRSELRLGRADAGTVPGHPELAARSHRHHVHIGARLADGGHLTTSISKIQPRAQPASAGSAREHLRRGRSGR